MSTRLTIFNHFLQTQQPPALAPDAGFAADDWLYAAVLAYAAHQPAVALQYCRLAAAAAPARLLLQASQVFLQRRIAADGPSVYDDGRAFAAFIRGGGNVGLYEALSDELRAVYQAEPPLRLLDVGVGDGLALLPALTAPPARLDLVEPSAAMLARTLAALQQRGLSAAAHQQTLQQFAAETTADWDLVQATFSLQTIDFAERRSLLRWLRGRTCRLLIAEFDAPDLQNPLHPDWFAYVVARYERGLAEYPDDGGLVAQGFLMPVFWGAFAATQRANYEQPRSRWIADLSAAGFTNIRTVPLYDYWWAPAFLLDAR
jgi:hypothetical protein